MPLPYPDIIISNNPDNAITDSDEVRGGGRRVANTVALYALTAKIDQLKEKVTEVYVNSLGYKMLLIDITNVGNSNGWTRSGNPPEVKDVNPTHGSHNAVESGGTYDAIQAVQAALDSYSIGTKLFLHSNYK